MSGIRLHRKKTNSNSNVLEQEKCFPLLYVAMKNDGLNAIFFMNSRRINYVFFDVKKSVTKRRMNVLLNKCKKTSMRDAVGQLLTQMKKMLDMKDVKTPFPDIIYDLIR